MKAILKIENKEIEVEVSEEQIEKLTAKKKNPFYMYGQGGDFYYIDVTGKLMSGYDNGAEVFAKMNKVANYCTDRDLIQQQAWRETLNRLLWRWQHENDEPVDWSCLGTKKYGIYLDIETNKFNVSFANISKVQTIHFSSKEKAEQAIEEVVKPFMAEHPDFIW